MALFEIPLPQLPGSFTVTLPDGEYRMRLQFGDGEDPCWILDIGDKNGTPLVTGIPVLPGENLLGQYEYLAIGGNVGLYVMTPGDPDHVPGFSDLGTSSHLFYGYAS